MTASQHFSRWSLCIRGLVGLAVLALVLWFADPSNILRSLGSAEPLTLFLIWCIAVPCRAWRGWKWNLLLRSQGIQLPTWQAIRLTFVGQFIGTCTPASLGGEAYRVAALRGIAQSSVVVTSIVMERYVGLFCVAVLALATLPFTFRFLLEQSPLAGVALIAVLTVIIFAPFVLFAWTGRWKSSLCANAATQRIHSLFQTLHQFAQARRTLLVFVLMTELEILCYLWLNYLAARSLQIPVSPAFVMCAMPLVHLLLRIPFSLQAIGIQEGALAVAFSLGGFTAAQGIALSLLLRALDWVCTYLPGAMLFVLLPGPRAAQAVTDDAVGQDREERTMMNEQ